MNVNDWAILWAIINIASFLSVQGFYKSAVGEVVDDDRFTKKVFNVISAIPVINTVYAIIFIAIIVFSYFKLFLQWIKYLWTKWQLRGGVFHIQFGDAIFEKGEVINTISGQLIIVKKLKNGLYAVKLYKNAIKRTH